MKELMILVRLVLLMLFLLQRVVGVGQTTISGEISQSSDGKIIIMYWENFSLIQDTILLDKNLKFFKNYSFSNPMYVKIIADVSTPFMLIFPGENLHAEIKNKKIQLNGTSARYNSFLIEVLNKADSVLKETDQNTATKYALGQCDSFFATFRHDKADAMKNLATQFLIFRYKFYYVLVRYNSDGSKMNILKSIIQGEPLPEKDRDIWEYFDQVKYNYEANKYDFQYLNMINNLVRILRFHAIGNDSSLVETDAYLLETDIIKNIFPPSTLRTTLLAYNLYYRIASYNDYPAQLGSVGDFIDNFKKEDNIKATYLPILLKKYTEARTSFGSLKKGVKAPGFRLKDLTGKSVSLSDYRGKVIYIDIWASWCGPCLKEMPYINQLKEKYKDKNLEVISISIDTKTTAWQKKINDLQLTGVQLIDDVNSEKSKIAKDYYISGVPHFVLIDKTGRIALALAPRPSETSLLEKSIDDLLK